MKKGKDIRFASSNGTDTVQGYAYEPETEICAVLQISHGMCEYIERYEPFIRYMTERGFAVCGNDHLGHGQTAGIDKLGFFAEKDGRKYIVKDLYTVTQHAKKRWPGKPYFLLGHSMGSFVARQYTAEYGQALDGVIFMGTSGKNPMDWAGIMMASALAALKGKQGKSKMIDKLAFGAYNKKIDHPQCGNDWLSRDAEVVRAYENDPYCKFSFTLSAYRELFALLHGVSSEKWAEQIPQALPILVISGEADPVGQYGKGVRQVYQWLCRTGHEDVTLKLYPGARHEVLNEENRQQVYQDVLCWLNEKKEQAQR